MMNLVLFAVSLIGALTALREMDISPEAAAESLLELHSFCD